MLDRLPSEILRKVANHMKTPQPVWRNKADVAADAAALAQACKSTQDMSIVMFASIAPTPTPLIARKIPEGLKSTSGVGAVFWTRGGFPQMQRRGIFGSECKRRPESLIPGMSVRWSLSTARR
jgi:hypothetical protein